MTTIGSSEAKPHLSELLARVAAGEEFVIAKHGRAVARLLPAAAPPPDGVQIVRDFLAARGQGGPTLGPGLTVRELIDDGRDG